MSSFLLSSCKNATYNVGPGSENKIEGNGKVTKEDRKVTNFNSLELNGVFNIILEQGRESVFVETDENLQEMIVVEVVDNVLKVHMKDSSTFSRMTKMNVYVTFNDISKLETESVGTLKCNSKLHLKNLELKVQGVGNTSLDLEAERLKVKAEIVGNLMLNGKVMEANIEHDGLGGIQAFGLETELMVLKTSGVGSSEVNATKELHVNASGVGLVKYKGNPAKKEISNTGIGKIISVD